MSTGKRARNHSSTVGGSTTTQVNTLRCANEHHTGDEQRCPKHQRNSADAQHRRQTPLQLVPSKCRATKTWCNQHGQIGHRSIKFASFSKFPPTKQPDDTSPLPAVLETAARNDTAKQEHTRSVNANNHGIPMTPSPLPPPTSFQHIIAFIVVSSVFEEKTNRDKSPRLNSAPRQHRAAERQAPRSRDSRKAVDVCFRGDSTNSVWCTRNCGMETTCC